jgi:hypothetical protein
MVEFALDSVVPLLVGVAGLAVYVAADTVVVLLAGFGISRVQTRRARAAAKAWVADEQWEAYLEYYATASRDAQQALLRVGKGRPELVDMYVSALESEWYMALAASDALRRAGTELSPQLRAAVQRGAVDSLIGAQVARRLGVTPTEPALAPAAADADRPSPAATTG